MFKIDLSPSYYAPVAIDMLDDDGVLRTHRFDARFKRLSEQEVISVHDRAEAGAVDDRAVLDEVMCGWRGVQNADGADIPYTADAREQVCGQVAGMRQALINAWFKSLTPRESAVLAEKN